MKHLFLIEDAVPNTVTYYLLVCFLAFLPFKMQYSEGALVALTAITLFTLKKNRFHLLLNKRVWILTGLYVLGLIGMLYSPDITEALNVSGRQLAMLLFPVLFALNGIDLNKYTPALLKIFSFSCVTAVTYLYAVAFYSIFSSHIPVSSLLSPAYMNHNFSLPIQLHATYLSMYAAFSVIILLYFFQTGHSVYLRIIYAGSIGILLAGMMQLSARAPLIALLFAVFIIFPFFMLNGKKRIRFIVGMAAVSAAVLFSIYHIDSFKTRYVGELKNDLGMDTLNVEFTEPRVIRWNAEMELIKRSPLVGYGSGSEKTVLHKKFVEKQLYIAASREFNSHNQYLSFWLNMGIAGLIAFLFVLGYGFRLAWKEKNIVFLGFIAIISMVAFSENILFLNKGIFFYSFFISLFFLTVKKATNTAS